MFFAAVEVEVELGAGVVLVVAAVAYEIVGVVVCGAGEFWFFCSVFLTGHLKDTAAWLPSQLRHLSVELLQFLCV